MPLRPPQGSSDLINVVTIKIPLGHNGAGYVSRAFRDYLRLVGIGHILAAPFHPQANGKVERYQQPLKREVNQLP